MNIHYSLVVSTSTSCWLWSMSQTKGRSLYTSGCRLSEIRLQSLLSRCWLASQNCSLKRRRRKAPSFKEVWGKEAIIMAKWRRWSVTHYEHLKRHSPFLRVRELCDSRGGRPGLPVPNSPYGLCGRKATFNSLNSFPNRAQELCPNSPYGLCGRKATLNLSVSLQPVWPSDNLQSLHGIA